MSYRSNGQILHLLTAFRGVSGHAVGSERTRRGAVQYVCGYDLQMGASVHPPMLLLTWGGKRLLSQMRAGRPSVITATATADAEAAGGGHRHSRPRRVDHARLRRGDRNRQASCGKAERHHEIPGLQH